MRAHTYAHTAGGCTLRLVELQLSCGNFPLRTLSKFNVTIMHNAGSLVDHYTHHEFAWDNTTYTWRYASSTVGGGWHIKCCRLLCMGLVYSPRDTYGKVQPVPEDYTFPTVYCAFYIQKIIKKKDYAFKPFRRLP